MNFTLIIGPMKSGKSLELIAQVAPHKFSKSTVGFYQPSINVRDENIKTRTGSTVQATKIASLKEIKEVPDVIGVDEFHMFPTSDYKVVRKWVKSGKRVYLSGLDLDYRGRLFKIVKHFYELKPDVLISKLSICDECKDKSAPFTQILNGKDVVTRGLDSIVPEDGTFVYQARCRECFITA